MRGGFYIYCIQATCNSAMLAVPVQQLGHALLISDTHGDSQHLISVSRCPLTSNCLLMALFDIIVLIHNNASSFELPLSLQAPITDGMTPTGMSLLSVSLFASRLEFVSSTLHVVYCSAESSSNHKLCVDSIEAV